jgi:hypothetical protein
LETKEKNMKSDTLELLCKANHVLGLAEAAEQLGQHLLQDPGNESLEAVLSALKQKAAELAEDLAKHDAKEFRAKIAKDQALT